MIFPSCSYVLLLGTVVFLQNVLSYQKPAWATVGLDLTPQEAEQLLMTKPSNGLYGSACQLCHSIFGLDISNGCLEELYVTGAVLLVTVIGLSILWISLKHMKNVKPSQAITETPSASEVKLESTQNNTKMLEQLVKATYTINKYMKYVIRHERKELKSKLRTRKICETESDASLPGCFCDYSFQDSA